MKNNPLHNWFLSEKVFHLKSIMAHFIYMNCLYHNGNGSFKTYPVNFNRVNAF